MALSQTYRSSLMFATGLCIAAGAALWVDTGWIYEMRSGQKMIDLSGESDLTVQEPRALTDADIAAAERAWRYIETNTRPYLLALVGAERLDIVTSKEFHARTGQLLDSFEKLPLFEGKLPNKAYNTQTLAMVDYTNTITPDGIGWSALDIARMLMALRSLEKLNPEYGDRIRNLLARWDLEAMTSEGELWGALNEDGEVAYKQEGRLGYEQYGARSAALWGMDVIQAISSRRALDWVDIFGVEVPTDVRRADVFRAITPILSEPYFLQAIELGFDSENRVMAERVYQAQEARYRETGIPTAVSEDHINQAPYFLYSAVYSNGEPWAVVTENGTFHPELRTQSVKASFAWDALYDTEYTDMLRTRIEDIGDPEMGWPAGIYEADGAINDIYTLNTNAIVLEAIHYMAHGPLWRIR